MQYRVFENGIEVNGTTVFSIVDGFRNFKIMASKYLLEQGIGEKGSDGVAVINKDAWYSQEKWLKAFENIGKEVGSGTLFQIGLKIPENAIFPPWVKDIDTAIKSIDVAYHMNHRKNNIPLFDPSTGNMKEGIGHYGFERLSSKNMIISECNNPYPCDFDKGIITAMAKKFELKASVTHLDSAPCRKNGTNSCTYIITW
ncbi:MAG: hypothetical protein A2Y33_09380 [Spirochaetes bacterium GWF1_51_8]|nr:MAG: hypothetical protein A2Y33_09380 [Spirochaetes bacterium GWF1_51_8]